MNHPKWRSLSLGERIALREAKDEERRSMRAMSEVSGPERALSDATHLEHERPRTRGDCVNAPRPCPWTACRQHLYLDVNPSTGKIKLNFPGKEPWEIEHSCALDLADRGGLTLTEVGKALGVTRERVRQMESMGLRMLGAYQRRLA